MRSEVKRLLMRLAGRDLPFAREVAVESTTLGTEYGSHSVCLRGLGTASVIYSFGVGEDVSFDLELIERAGLTVHAFDPTPRSIAWVKSKRMPPNFIMHAVGLAAYDGVARMWPPDDPTHISHTLIGPRRTAQEAIEVAVNRLATLMRGLGHDRLDVLKLDIEGAEYDVIDDVIASRVEVDQILVEFHHHLRGVPLGRTRGAVEALRGAGYRILHVSRSGQEYSFIHERLLHPS
jgi:FkbM family methyltransferase